MLYYIYMRFYVIIEIFLFFSSYNKVLDHARGHFFAASFANYMWNHKVVIMQKCGNFFF